MATQKDTNRAIIESLKAATSSENSPDRKWEEERKARLNAFYDNQRQRDGFVKFVKWFLSLWMLFIAIIVVFNGCFQLADKVLMALIATTTVNVIALSIAVIKGVFNDYRHF